MEEISGSWDTDFILTLFSRSVLLWRQNPHHTVFPTGNLQGPSHPACRQETFTLKQSVPMNSLANEVHGVDLLPLRGAAGNPLWERRAGLALRPAPIGYGPLTLPRVLLHAGSQSLVFEHLVPSWRTEVMDPLGRGGILQRGWKWLAQKRCWIALILSFAHSKDDHRPFS